MGIPISRSCNKNKAGANTDYKREKCKYFKFARESIQVGNFAGIKLVRWM